MSATLTWRSLESKCLPDQLKFVLRDKCNWEFPKVVSEYHISFFEGLAAAEIIGANEVLDLIEKHGQIELDLEY